MQAYFSYDPKAQRDLFCAEATQEEWEEIMRNIDGIGHSPALLALKEGLKEWGITK